LSNAEVIGIDLDEGKVTHVSKSRKGIVPGNLFCFKGKVVSQGLDGVEAYYQLDAALPEVERRLAANPDNAEALSLHGEILLDAGKRSEAIVALRRAYELAPDPRTRELLRDSLLGGLRTEFAAYRDHGKEIKQLLDAPEQHATFLRLMGDGLRHAGELVPAFECYLNFVDFEPDRRPLDQVDQNFFVRRDRWVQGRLAELREEAQGEAAAMIDDAVSSRLRDALATDSVDVLQQFFDDFDGQPAAVAGRAELVRRFQKAGRRLEAELAASRWEMPLSTPSRDAVKSPPDWPVGKVEVAIKSTKNVSSNDYGRYAVELRGNPGSFFRDLSIQLTPSNQQLIAYDGWGQERWQVALVEKGQQRQHFSYNRSMTHARAQEHLLLVSLGGEILAIDALGRKSGGTPRLLWIRDALAMGGALDGHDVPLLNLPWQIRQQVARSQGQSGCSQLLDSRYICFQQFRDLVAVDPISGETLWVHQDLPLGCELFGDDEYVFALPPDREEAMLFRAADGEPLGTRKVPRQSVRQRLSDGTEKNSFSPFKNSCLAALGRKLLLWWPEGNERTLTLVDPLEGRDIWPGRKFSNRARACVVGEEAVGVMEPDGRFVLISLPDGRTIADLKLKAERSLIGITLLRSGDQHFLLTRSSPDNVQTVPMQPMPGGSFEQVRQGRLYAFDRQGSLQWPAPVKIKNQFLLTDQPSHLPVLTFACQVYTKNLLGRGQYNASVLCIDKRSGRVVYEKSSGNSTSVFHVVGDAVKKTIDIVMRQKTITLTFTDKPLLPPSEVSGIANPSSPASKGARVIWNSIQRMLGRAPDESEIEVEEEERIAPRK